MSRDTLYQQVRSHLAYLKLGAAAEALPGQLDAALKSNATHTEFLHQLLAVEVTAVEARRHAGMLRFANFPSPWWLEDFDYTAQPSVDPALMRDLATCRYAEDSTNVLFIGPPGVGKTMLAIALGHAAVDAGLRTYYTTAVRPRRPLPQSRRRRTLGHHHAVLQRTVRSHRRRARLPPDAREDANALFQVVSQRYLHGSIILTTNRGVGGWGDIFADTTIAAAMLDRLLHRSVVININGDSYPMRTRRARNKRLTEGGDT